MKPCLHVSTEEGGVKAELASCWENHKNNGSDFSDWMYNRP
jgi:hypothetical protein